MQKILIEKFDAADVLVLKQVEMPVPKANQVLIKIHAAGLNPIDYKIREGSSFVAEQLKNDLPIGLGYEMSGEIVEIDGTIKNFQVGDKVCGFAGFPLNPGCYAEYVVTESQTITKIPKKVAAVVAATLPLAGLTAWQAVNLLGELKNKTILIHAAAGGVGHIAVQLAKQKGAEVVVTALSANHAFLKALGADQCIDYQQQDFTKILFDLDAVLDLLGGETGKKSLNIVKPQAKFVSVPTFSLDELKAAGQAKNITVEGLLMTPDMQSLDELLQLVVDQKLQVVVQQIFALNQAQAAHQLLQSGHVRGKLSFAFM